MHAPPGDPRYGRPHQPGLPRAPHPPGPRPVHPLAAHGQPYPTHPPSPSPYPSAPPPAMQAAPMPPGYGSAPPQAYASSPPALQQPYPSPPPPAPGAGWRAQLPSFGGVGPPAGLAGALPNVAQPSGLPAALAFGLGFAACLVALVFDLVFLKVHIPGVGGYAWYLTTALSFAGAGYAGRKWTRAPTGMATAAAGVAAAVYGALDLGLGLVIEDLSLGAALVLAAQGIVIAAACGVGGVQRASRALEG